MSLQIEERAVGKYYFDTKYALGHSLLRRALFMSLRRGIARAKRVTTVLEDPSPSLSTSIKLTVVQKMIFPNQKQTIKSVVIYELMHAIYVMLYYVRVKFKGITVSKGILSKDFD